MSLTTDWAATAAVRKMSSLVLPVAVTTSVYGLDPDPVDDYGLWELNANGDYTINGFGTRDVGRLIVLLNVGANDITLTRDAMADEVDGDEPYILEAGTGALIWISHTAGQWTIEQTEPDPVPAPVYPVSAAPDPETIALRDSAGDLHAETFRGDLDGNATTADYADEAGHALTSSAWLNARSVTFSGGNVIGSFSIDGSASVSGIFLAIANLAVTNAMLAGSIADSKLSTIGTSGKVANSATTAASANTASAIVARDASGNFSANQITGSLIGTASTASQLLSTRSFSATGDVSATAQNFNGTANVSMPMVLAASGVVAGTYSNSATQHHPFTVDSKGRITGVGAATTITPAWSSITSKPTTVGGYGITDLPGVTNGKAVFAAGYNNPNTGAVNNTGFTLTLPTAGTYFVAVQSYISVLASAATIYGYLYRDTPATAFASVTFELLSASQYRLYHINGLVTTTAPNETVSFRIQKGSTAAPNDFYVLPGQTNAVFFKIA